MQAITKNLRVVASELLSDGEGRYLFGAGAGPHGAAPTDLSARFTPTAAIDGFEATVKNTLLYAYYGGDYIGRNVAHRRQRHVA